MKQALIVSDPNILGAKPIVAGTRLTVEFVLDNLSAGRTPQQLYAKHPPLTPEVIQATKEFALDAVRQNSIDTYRIPVHIRHLIVALEPDETVAQIEEAFGHVVLGNGPSLRQMSIMDNYGRDDQGREISMQEYRNLKAVDETHNWRALTVDDLNKYNYLSHGDAESVRFYIPALMIQTLADHYGEDVLFRLTPSDYHMMQYSLLDAPQKVAIARFLWHLLDFDDLESYTVKAAETALERYWMPFLEPPTEQKQPAKKRKVRKK